MCTSRRRTRTSARSTASIEKIVQQTTLPEGVRVRLRGTVQSMRASFSSFGLGLILSVVLVYLILVAQFASFLDPLLILLAIPTGLTGVHPHARCLPAPRSTSCR